MTRAELEMEREAEREAARLRQLSAGLGLLPVEPPGPTPADDGEPAALAALYRRLLDEVDTPWPGAPMELGARTARRGLSRLDLRAVAAAVVALVAVSAVWLSQSAPAAAEPPVLRFSAVVGPLTPDSGTPAREALLRIANAAAEQAPPSRAATATTQHVVTDQWRLEVETDAAADRHVRIRPTHNESWLFADGRTRYLEVATDAAFAPDGELIDSDTEAGDVVRDEIMPAFPERDAHWASQLPRDPDALEHLWLRWVDDPAVENPTSATVVIAHEISRLFDTWVVSPDLAATAWTVLAAQEDVRDLGTVTDRAGRAGQGFAVWNANESALEVLIVDPSTGDLLGTEYVLFEPGSTVQPVVGSFTTYRLAEWIVDG